VAILEDAYAARERRKEEFEDWRYRGMPLTRKVQVSTPLRLWKSAAGLER
jgi:hypothetical protein